MKNKQPLLPMWQFHFRCGSAGGQDSIAPSDDDRCLIKNHLFSDRQSGSGLNKSMPKMEFLIRVFFLSLLVSACSTVNLTRSTISNRSTFEVSAAAYLKEYKTKCAAEGGVTWNHSLCVPMIIIDRDTLDAVTTVADPRGSFKDIGGLYVGTYYGEKIYANTSVKWGTERWSMVLWPLPENTEARTQLLFHESFHSIQDEIGLPMNNAINDHLDQEEARVLIRLEWNALLAAMSDSKLRKSHISNALKLREMRFSKYKDAQKNEDMLEMNEGLAEYTGIKLRGSSTQDTLIYLSKKVTSATDVPSLIRSSAYYSGPLYGLLLDTSGKEWRSAIRKRQSFGTLTAEQFDIKKIRSPRQISDSNLEKYGANGIREFEKARAKAIQSKIDGYIGKIEKPRRLRLGLRNPQMMFDPYGIFSISSQKKLYTTLEVNDDWGTLKAKDGALLEVVDKTFTISVGPPQSTSRQNATGEGWTLQLKPGWTVIAAGQVLELREDVK